MVYSKDLLKNPVNNGRVAALFIILPHEEDRAGSVGRQINIFPGIFARLEAGIGTKWETGMIKFLVVCSPTYLSRKPSS